MTETETETMTKTQQRTIEKNKERERQKARTKARIEAQEERDAAIRQVNAVYQPQIQKLKDEHRAALKEIWDNWKEQRAKAE